MKRSKTLWTTLKTLWTTLKTLWNITKHSNTSHSMSRDVSARRHRCLARRHWCSAWRHWRSARRHWRSARRHRRSRGVSGDIGAGFPAISTISVGITPQMCNRVTNHGDMGTFSKPDSLPFARHSTYRVRGVVADPVGVADPKAAKSLFAKIKLISH